MTNPELYHWGIKGMRWGVRRYQNKDGSLTPAGKKRYADDPDLQGVDSAKIKLNAAKRALNKASNRYNTVSTKANWKRYEEAQTEFTKSKFAYNKSKLKYDTKKEVSRIRDNNIQIKNKSKHRLRLEEQYKQMGMSNEEAQAAANNRIRTERILAASAAVAVSACAAYVIRSKIKDRTDGLIKAGEVLQRVEMQDTGGKLHDVFYVAKGKRDMQRYENLLGATRQKQTGHAFMMKLSASQDIKVASKDRAMKVFDSLYKSDNEFKKAVDSHVAGYEIKNLKQRYERFNQELVGMRNQGPDKKFYDALKKAGYGAIQDINDMKFSGYNAKNPLIVFDNSNKNIMVRSVKEMTGDLQQKGSRELLKATGETLAEDFMKKAGLLSAAGLTTAAVTTYRSDPNDAVGNNQKRKTGK
jgi:hypothetical protein